MKNLFLTSCFFLICTQIYSCTPSPEAIEKAIFETVAASDNQITNTSKPSSTTSSTFEPSVTITPFPKTTFTPFPTMTPDLWVIDTDPINLLCTKNDLPIEGRYIIPSGWSNKINNEKFIRENSNGTEYINNTDRVTGSWVAFYSDTSFAPFPDIIYCGVYMFKTTTGARLALIKYNDLEFVGSRKDYNFEYIDKEISIGDGGITYIGTNESKGDTDLLLTLQFTYRNLLIEVLGYSNDIGKLNVEDLEIIAHQMLYKIEASRLVFSKNAYWPE